MSGAPYRTTKEGVNSLLEFLHSSTKERACCGLYPCIVGNHLPFSTTAMACCKCQCTVASPSWPVHSFYQCQTACIAFSTTGSASIYYPHADNLVNIKWNKRWNYCYAVFSTVSVHSTKHISLSILYYLPQHLWALLQNPIQENEPKVLLSKWVLFCMWCTFVRPW